MTLEIENLWDMWKFAAVSMPRAAVKFVEAADQIDTTRGLEYHTFTSANIPTSPLAEPFAQLRDMVQDEIFVKSRDNLVKAGDTLEGYVLDVSEVDSSASTELNNRIEDLEQNGQPYEQPLDSVPEATSSDTSEPEYPPHIRPPHGNPTP